MIFLTAFLLTISAVHSSRFDSSDCFHHTEMDCMENFVDAVFYSNRGVDECSELRKFVDCSTDAVDECFGDERDEKVQKGLEELENLCEDTCGAVASGDNSDFDEETYSHIELTASFRRRKKKASHSTTDKRTRVSSDSTRCFGERKKICWDTFENAVIHSVFYSSEDLDKCSALQHFVLCTRKAADDCFENEDNEDAKEILDVWENKSNEFCEADISDEKSVRVPLMPGESGSLQDSKVQSAAIMYDTGRPRPPYRKESSIDDSKVQSVASILLRPLYRKKSSFDDSNVQSVVTINDTGISRPPHRKNKCMIRQLETPVFQHISNEEVGAWFQDAMPTDETKYKSYSIIPSSTNHLFEFNSRNDDGATEIYELPFPFFGTGHLVYNGSFYYHETKSQMLVRCDFNHERNNAIRIADASYNDENYLYSSKLGYMDVMADENGLWVVYSAKDTNNTLVRKIHPYTLVTEFMWNLTLPHSSVAEMFIACGVLYSVNSTTDTWPSIGFAYDLYQNRSLEVSIPLPYSLKSISMIAYNPRFGQLFTWDKANQLAYPVLFDTVDLGEPDQNDISK